MILFGSVVLHEARPPSDPSPSDVDLLAIFDTTDRLVKPYREDISGTIIDAYAHHLDAPREVNMFLSDRTMQTWGSMFLENLARDGILLYARGSLTAPLATRETLHYTVRPLKLLHMLRVSRVVPPYPVSCPDTLR